KGTAPQHVSRKRAVRRVAQQALSHELHAGENERSNPPRTPPREASLRIHVEIALAPEVTSLIVGYQQKQRIHPLCVPHVGQLGQGISRTIEPDVVAVQATEWIG